MGGKPNHHGGRHSRCYQSVPYMMLNLFTAIAASSPAVTAPLGQGDRVVVKGIIMNRKGTNSSDR